MLSTVEKYFFFMFSCVLGFSSCQALDRVVPLVDNPRYLEFLEHESFGVTNGSMVNFAARGFVGKSIRAASALNDVPNPLGLTHSGIVFLESPRTVWDIIYSLTPNGEDGKNDGLVSRKEGRAMLEKLQSYFGPELESDEKHPFLLESNGTAGQVIGGIYPHVQISPFLDALKNYGGNVYIRPFLIPVPSDFIVNFVKEHMGRSYEKNPMDLIRSVNGFNRVERTGAVFCSEFVGMFYKSVIEVFPLSPLLSKENILEKFSNVSNLIPEYFCSSIEKDVLQGIAGEDILLKHVEIFKDEEGGCCLLL